MEMRKQSILPIPALKCFKYMAIFSLNFFERVEENLNEVGGGRKSWTGAGCKMAPEVC